MLSNKKMERVVVQNNIKSPSDKTIYVPALQKKLTPNGGEGFVYVTQIKVEYMM